MLHSVLLVLSSVLPQDPVPAATPDKRQEALTELVSKMRTLHPNLFFGVSEAEFTTTQHALEDRLGELDDDQFTVELMRLVASISREAGRDGHAVVMPVGRWTILPLRLYAFDDGWFVTAAREPHEDLVGARVLTIGGVPIEQVAERIAPLVPRDNQQNLRTKLPGLLVRPALLHVLGIGESRERASL